MRIHITAFVMIVVGYCATQGVAGQGDQQKPVRIQTDWQVQQTLRITGNRPIYPAFASFAHVEGVVRLDCVISTDGSVVNIVYLSGPAMLIQASIDAVREWRFKPTLVEGIAVEVETIARIDFFLSGNSPSSFLLSYQKDVQKHPDDVKAREALGKALVAVGQPNQAILEFRQIVLLHPENASYHFELGDAIAATGDLDGAIGEYRSGLLRNPGDAFARDRLAGWLDRRGDLDGAIAEILEAIKLKSREFDGHFHLGTLLEKKGDIDGAIVEFKHAMQQNPFVHFNLGRIYEHKGDLDAALKEYKTAVHDCPSCAGFQEARDRVAKLPNK